VGTRGAAPSQLNTPHGMQVDEKGNVYVADRGNNRIQVYDGTSMTFKTSFTGVAAPWTVQATAKYIYSGDGTGKIYRLDKSTGKYRLDPDRKARARRAASSTRSTPSTTS
jgi:DNA-binding beta-propeller fold protein YncE